MLDWLATIAAAKVGEAVFEQVLKLGQAAAEDYVKDFFKDCLKGGIASTKPEVTKKAVATALKEFLAIVTEELEDKDLSQAEIRDHYESNLIQFVKDAAVKPLLGKAFELDCGKVDTEALSQIWQRSSLKGRPFSPMPDGFDWAAVGALYLKKVRRIVRETPELRSLLDLDLQEQQAESLKQLAGINPGFDVAKYRESLICSYGYLKLHTLDSTDRADAIRLWSMFIQQTVREALPPLRYEVPLDVKRQLQAEGGLEADLSPEDLAHYRQDYFQQPLRKVFEALADVQRAVILGDPGAGKSTLLQYLALEWVERKAQALPLLIELREYVLAGVNGFLEFLHRGRSADWQFDKYQLHQHLLEQPTIVMLDGLDEVFDRATQATIVDEIIRFSQQYPKSRILVTSRIIGYNPERLQQASFKQFTIQPLDRSEMHEFIDRWYELALGSDVDKARLVKRLKDAIENSQAFQDLADNPLLLTMMAILNREPGELPGKRIDLYNRASVILLDKWDSERKQFPDDVLKPWVKQGMLRLVAYEMQTSTAGLKGNLIQVDRLTRILTNYLRDQGFEAPREKANGLIDQLQRRNWILCDRGSDTYGFVHRTFLEYFCAMEIVHRFEKVRSISFEQLRDEVFGLHWQDETWHEVLRLICGAIDEEIAAKLVDFMLDICDRNYIIKKDITPFDSENNFEEYDFSEYLDKKIGIDSINLFQVSSCYHEIRSSSRKKETYSRLLDSIQNHLQNLYEFIETSGGSTMDYFVEDGTYIVFSDIAKFGQNNSQVFVYLSEYAHDAPLQEICSAAVRALVDNWTKNQDLLECLISVSIKNPFDTCHYDALYSMVVSPRAVALNSLLVYYPTHPKTIELFHDRALNDPDDQLRQWAQDQLRTFTHNQNQEETS